MKIGIEGQRLYRTKKHGMDMVALELVKYLQKIDKVNEYVVFVKPDEDRDCLQETENFKIVELGGGPYPIWEQYALPKAAAAEGCDILHCTSNTAPINSKVPIMITLHDIIYMESIAIFKKAGTWYQKFGNMYRRYVIPRIMKKSKRIITVSNFERERIAQFFNYPKDDKTLVAVYNGVSEHFVPINDQAELKRVKDLYKLPEEFIFFLGNTDPKKNTIGALTAYRDFCKKFDRKIPLIMLDYDMSELKRLLNQIGAPELIDNIMLTGYVVNTDLPAIYNLCTIFLYPSLRESFGIPMLEAMRCGAPVITSNTSSMPEVSGNAGIIVDPHNFAQITEAMLTLMNDEELKKVNIEKGFKNAAKFSWENMAKDVLKLYEDIYAEIK